MGKVWFEGVPHEVFVFTEEDLAVVLKLLDERRGGFGTQNEYDRVFNRILIQKKK